MLEMARVQMIQTLVLREGESIRSTARRLGVSRNTVRAYLRGAVEPGRRRGSARRRPVLEAVGPRIDALLEEWSQRTTAKQRITGTRVHRALVAEGYAVGITTVRTYLREKRRAAQEVYVPLVYAPGEVAQVDFFEVAVDVDGQRQKAWMFVMRLMYSGADFVRLYAHCDQPSFLDGHVRGFAHVGGVPRRMVYDNLKPAVQRIVKGGRELSRLFAACAAHYCFEPCFARPGEGHDKGGVEGRGKGIRLQHLTPIPEGESLAALSEELQRRVDVMASATQNRTGRTVAERFAEEKAHLLPVPARAFDGRRTHPGVEVSSKSLVRVEGAVYSVPSRWARGTVTALVGPETVTFVYGKASVTHRRVGRGQENIDYRHHLRELARKPQALRQVADVLIPSLGPPFTRLWAELLERMAPLDAARSFAKVLHYVDEHGQEAVRQALWALSCEPDHVCLRLGLALRPQEQAGTVAVPESLRGYDVPAARAADFDSLLGCAAGAAS